MKGKIKRGVFYLVLGFLALFGFRLIYGYVVTPGLSDTGALGKADTLVEGPTHHNS